jgi:hypothetical protein
MERETIIHLFEQVRDCGRAMRRSISSRTSWRLRERKSDTNGSVQLEVPATTRWSRHEGREVQPPLQPPYLGPRCKLHFWRPLGSGRWCILHWKGCRTPRLLLLGGAAMCAGKRSKILL